MEREEFFETIKESILDFLPETYDTAEVVLRSIEKNNGCKLAGLSVCKSGEKMSPIVYIDSYFDQYEAGRSLLEIRREIANIIVNSKLELSLDISDLTDYDRVKNFIVCQLINYERNSDRLKNLPHKRVVDLAIIYKIKMDHDDTDVSASVTIDNAMLSAYGISVDKLHEDAISNTRSLLPGKVLSLYDVLEALYREQLTMQGFMPDEVDNMVADIAGYGAVPMLVVSNSKKMNGAVSILDLEVQETLIQKLGNRFFLIPSSIHEMLAVPYEDIEPDVLKDMVPATNNECVNDDEILSDNVYIFDSGSISIVA